MQTAKKDLTPIIYSAGAIKSHRFQYAAAAECFPMHWHEHMEVFYVREGALSYVRGGEKGILQAGQARFVPPRTVHHARAAEAVTYDVLLFDLRYFYNETDVCRAILPPLFEGQTTMASVTEDPEILATIHRLCWELKPDSLVAVSDIYILLHLIVDKHLVGAGLGMRDDDMRNAARYMEENYPQELSVASLSRRFGYTAAHFCRKFKRATGLSPVVYLRICRLERAYRMLKQNEGGVGEIAARCGFADANYFTRCFTAHYGHPPSHYRA